MRASLSLEFPSVAPGRAVDPHIRPATQPGNGDPLRRGRRRREPLGELEVLPVVDRAHHDRPSFRKGGGLVDAPGGWLVGRRPNTRCPTYLVKHTGDGMMAVFARAPDAIAAAVQAQRGLHTADWGRVPLAVRMAVHSGDADPSVVP